MTHGKTEAPRAVKIATEAARALGGVGEGIACAGTTLEAKTFTVSSKAFLFVGRKAIRLKLLESISEAQASSRRSDSSIQTGTGGWTTIRLDAAVPLDESTLKRWVAESHALFQKPPARHDAPMPRPTASLKPPPKKPPQPRRPR